MHRLLTGTPLLIGANRDENKDRPASGPETLDIAGRKVLAPKDLEAGGTWLGTNDAGLFVGITNRFAATRHPDRRSRGEIPLLALAHKNPQQAVEAIRELKATAFNAFHLLLANAQDARIIWSNGETFHEKELEPGIHILTESSFEAGPPDRTRFIAEYLEALVANDQVTIPDIQKLLGEKRDPSFHGLCVSRQSLRNLLLKRVLLHHVCLRFHCVQHGLRRDSLLAAHLCLPQLASGNVLLVRAQVRPCRLHVLLRAGL